MSEKLKTICHNPWCKCTFYYTEDDMIEVDGTKIPPKICNNCKSFDTELSDGVTWCDREYDDEIYDYSLSHHVTYKVTNYK
jgi:hypothetical protein